MAFETHNFLPAGDCKSLEYYVTMSNYDSYNRQLVKQCGIKEGMLPRLRISPKSGR